MLPPKFELFLEGSQCDRRLLVCILDWFALGYTAGSEWKQLNNFLRENQFQNTTHVKKRYKVSLLAPSVQKFKKRKSEKALQKSVKEGCKIFVFDNY